jgi:hypothetical protein
MLEMQVRVPKHSYLLAPTVCFSGLQTWVLTFFRRPGDLCRWLKAQLITLQSVVASVVLTVLST